MPLVVGGGGSSPYRGDSFLCGAAIHAGVIADATGGCAVALPHSPAAAPVLPLDCADGRPVSPLSLKMDAAADEGQKAARPKIPAFLDQSQQGSVSCE